MWSIHLTALLLLFIPFSHSSDVVENLGNQRKILNVNSTAPTLIPTALPSLLPTSPPSESPSPTVVPIPSPSRSPTTLPSSSPSAVPVPVPTPSPTSPPTSVPTISLQPTISLLPSPLPTLSLLPSYAPTSLPTLPPSFVPTLPPSFSPTALPTATPFPPPTMVPTSSPTGFPTMLPSTSPMPTQPPSPQPTYSLLPTSAPSQPTIVPSIAPTQLPTLTPSSAPSPVPTSLPTDDTYVSVYVSIVMYVNLATGVSSTPTAVQAAELKTQLANLTDIPEENMYGFTLTLNAGNAPTPAPTTIPTPVPTPVPTGVCGCPRAYYNYIGESVLASTRLCSVFSPETLNNYICCQYCCHRTAGVCNTNFDNTSIYDIDTRRMLEEEASSTLEQFEDAAETVEETRQHRLLRSSDTRQHRELLSFYWDVSYRVLASASQLGYTSITSTELATLIFNKIYNAGLHRFKLTDVLSIYPEKAGSDRLIARGVTRSPTPQPSSPAPSRTPTHLPSQSVVPTFVPTAVPIPSPVALPTLSPSHAPTRYHIEYADKIYLGTSLYDKLSSGVVPVVILFITFIAFCFVTYCRETCWFCFPDEDGLQSLVMFSSFAGNEASTAKQDEKYVSQHRSGAVYTWAKQFHSKYLVMGTPTGLKLHDTFQEVELQQMQPYSTLLNKKEESKNEIGEDFLRVVDDGGLLTPNIPQRQPQYDDHGHEIVEKEHEKLDRLESIAVKMAMKQQELVNALSAAEERQSELQDELVELRNSKGHRAKVVSINQSTMELGTGEHTNFLDGWLAGGAMIDGHIKDAPTYDKGLTEAELAALKQMKQVNKAKKKAAEAKARRKSARGSFKARSRSMNSNDSNEEGSNLGEMATRVAEEVAAEQRAEAGGWDMFGSFTTSPLAES